jgi:hypothetical protein
MWRPRRESALSTNRRFGHGTLLIMAVLLGLTSAVLAGQVRCQTCEEKTLNRLQSLCDDGTRAISHFNQTLQRWETTITENPRKACAE